MTEYKFSEEPETACITCKHVLEDGADVLLVTHDSDDEGGWQFLCGAEGHDEADARVVGIGQIIELQPDLNYLFEMPVGIAADRATKDSEWEFFEPE